MQPSNYIQIHNKNTAFSVPIFMKPTITEQSSVHISQPFKDET